MERTNGEVSEQFIRSNKSFGDLVNLETLLLAGFNYAEPSLGLMHEGRYVCVFISDERKYINPNIVIIEESKQDGAVQWREFYFGSFPGKPIGQRKGIEVDEYVQKLQEIISPEHHVDGTELERLIRQELME